MKATILIVGQGCTIKERTSRLVRCRCCKYLHENGNCLKTDNFCMSVQDSDCPKIKKGERTIMTVKDEQVLAKIHEFIEDNNIDCPEDVFQRDSVNEQCVDLVAELVMKERKKI